MLHFNLNKHKNEINEGEQIMRLQIFILLGLVLGIGFTVAFNDVIEQKSKKFGNHQVTQIGLVVHDIEKSTRAYAALLGMPVPQIMVTDPLEKAHTLYRGKSTEAQAKLAFFHLENITIELIEPIGGPSTWQEALENQGEGIHHIAFQVQGMDEHISLLEKQGGNLVQRGDFTGGSYAYVDLSPQLGVILELLTSTNEESKE